MVGNNRGLPYSNKRQWLFPKIWIPKNRVVCHVRRLESFDKLLCERRRHVSQAKSLAEYANDCALSIPLATPPRNFDVRQKAVHRFCLKATTEQAERAAEKISSGADKDAKFVATTQLNV